MTAMPMRPRATAYTARKTRAEKERRTEVLLEEEEHQRGGHADEDGKDVLASRQIDPRGHSHVANGLAPNLPEQLPSPRKIPREEQRKEQTDRFDRLEGPEIDLGRAAAGSVSEEDQEHGERERGDQREVAERDESHAPRHRRATTPPSAPGRSAIDFRISHEEQAVAQGIRAAQEHGEANGGQQVCRGQQQDVASNCAAAARKARPHESRERRARRTATPDAGTRRASARSETASASRCPPGVKRGRLGRRLAVQLTVAGKWRRRSAACGDRVRSPIKNRNSSAAAKRRSFGVRERDAERRFQRLRVAYGIQIHDACANAGLRCIERAEPADAGQRDREHRDAGGGRQQRLGPAVRASRRNRSVSRSAAVV